MAEEKTYKRFLTQVEYEQALALNNQVCSHVFKRGDKTGTYCGAKAINVSSEPAPLHWRCKCCLFKLKPSEIPTRL